MNLYRLYRIQMMYISIDIYRHIWSSGVGIGIIDLR